VDEEVSQQQLLMFWHKWPTGLIIVMALQVRDVNGNGNEAKNGVGLALGVWKVERLSILPYHSVP
jgi:hypothetical protein